MKKKGKVLSLWKTVLLVFAGMIAIAGGTALTLFLMGEFNEKNIDPENFSFVETVVDGEAYCSGMEQGNYVFQTSSDFKLMITTGTEDATNKEITLQLKGGVTRNGYVSDGIISVKEKAEIGKPIDIMLVKQFNSDINDNWVVGGQGLRSELTAKSENINLPSQKIYISVDVPVYDIDVDISVDDQSEQETEGDVREIALGSTFAVDATFTPGDSEYLFGDSSTSKKQFYKFSASCIDYNWTTGKFLAKTKTEGVNLDYITVYVFSNSFYQKEFFDREDVKSITDPYELNAKAIQYFTECETNNETYKFKTDTINIKVKEEEVRQVVVDVKADGTETWYAYVDKKFYITTGTSLDSNENFGLVIKGEKVTLNTLVGNFGIKLPKTADNVILKGGDIIKVVETEGVYTITMEEYDPTVNYFAAEAGIEYYLLPNSTPENYNEYFWEFSTTQAQSLELKYNFFQQKDGVWTNFFDFASENKVVLEAQNHDIETVPSWSKLDAIPLVINYDEAGKPISSNVDLADEIQDIDKDNIYRTVKYFLFIDRNEMGFAETINMIETFNCSDAVLYAADYKGQALVIPNTTTPAEGFTLYELSSSVLTAKKSYAGAVKVVAALVRTNADNKIVYDEGGKYQIVAFGKTRVVTVESTLSVANMTPTFVMSENVETDVDGNFFVPAVKRNESGEQATMITFKMVLENSEDVASDSEKVVAAFEAGTLDVVCVGIDGKETNQYVKLAGLAETAVEETTVTFEGALNVNEGLFKAATAGLDQGTYVRLLLKYNDGKETYEKEIVHAETGKEYFRIYYQQPTSLVGDYATNPNINIASTIEVNISATDGTSIKWGTEQLAGNTTEDVMATLNNYLTFKMQDQRNKDIDYADGLYTYKLVEEPLPGNSKILSFDSTQTKVANFSSTEGESVTTKLYVYAITTNGDNIKFEGNDLRVGAFTFQITSQGVSRVEYDSTTLIQESADQIVYTDVDEDSNALTTKSVVYVSKYVKPESLINLAELINVFTTDEDGTEVLASDLRFYLDNSYLSSMEASTDAQFDIMKMLAFDVESDAEDEDSIVYYKNKLISQISIINPFNESTTVTFRVRDTAEALFDITLNVVFLSDLTIAHNFNNFYEANKDYLVSKDSQIGVLAGTAYDLDSFFPIVSAQHGTGTTYTWVGSLKDRSEDDLKSNPEGVFYDNGNICSIKPILDDGGNVEKMVLEIGEISEYKTITLVLYYGTNSQYACRVEVTLYVNPNFVIKQNVNEEGDIPFVDLGLLATANPASHYSVYKLTEYLAADKKFDSLTAVAGISYTNISTSKYITVTESAFGLEQAQLQMTLGEVFEQKFKIMIGTSAVAAPIVACYTDGTSSTTKCPDVFATINFQIGFGAGDPATMASTILKKKVGVNKVDVPIVEYEGQTMLVLVAGFEYEAQGGFNITNNITGQIKQSAAGLMVYGTIPNYVSFEGNEFVVKRDISSGPKTLEVFITLKAVVSQIGENFVVYEDDKDAALDVLLGDYQALEDAGVAQQLVAGKSYQVVYDTDLEITDPNPYGFYFEGTTAGLTGESKTANYTLSIVEEAEGYVENLATVEGDRLVINNMGDSYTDAYIVLKLDVVMAGDNSKAISWYYRIHVVPNFVMGQIYYPYADGAEYLDGASVYYKENATYEIDFEEKLKTGNSKHDPEPGDPEPTRFGLVEWAETPAEAIVYRYNVVSAENVSGAIPTGQYANYFTYSVSDAGVMTIKLANAANKLKVVVRRSIFVGDIEVIGGTQDYVFLFNQSANYVPTVTLDGTPLTHENYIYRVTLNAGADDYSTLKVSLVETSNNTSSPVDSFSVFYGAADFNILTCVDDLYIDEEVSEIYILPAWAVDKDYEFVVGIFTNQKLAFRVFVTITSYFDWEDNNVTEFVGGKTYYTSESIDGDDVANATGTNTFFTSISSNKPGTTVEDVLFTLTNGDEVYSDAGTPEDDSDDILYSDLVKFDLATKSIKFARLEKDVTFNFDITIKDSDDMDYTFAISKLVKADFDRKKVAGYDITNAIFAADTETVSIGDILNCFKGTSETEVADYQFATAANVIVCENVSTLTFKNTTLTVNYLFEGKVISTFTVKCSYAIKPNVTVVAHGAAPDGTTELTSLGPDGETMIATEYVSTFETSTYEANGVQRASETYPNFFANKALLGLANRVVGTKIEPATITEAEWQWKISVYSLTNAVVIYNGKVISAESTDKILSTTGTLTDIVFGLIDQSSNGEVVFSVEINAVPVLYKVVLVNGEVILTEFNQPNWENGQEKIYAEDLAGYEDQHLFAEDRIVTYTFKATVEPTKTYYLKFVNATQGIEYIVATKAKTPGSKENVDFGKILTGYAYQGTYESKENASENVGALTDSNIYDFAPTIKNRIVAKYYTGTVLEGITIKFVKNQERYLNYKFKAAQVADTTYFLRFENTTSGAVQVVDIVVKNPGTAVSVDYTSALKGYAYVGTFSSKAKAESNEDKLTDANIYETAPTLTMANTAANRVDAATTLLTKDDYGKSVIYSVVVSIGTVNIETNNPYTVFMDVEFTVQGNADSMTGYRTINIKAGEEKSLLTTYNSGLADIINKRTGLHYTPQALQASTGNIDLRMYGYTSDSTRYAGDALYQTAVAFDNKLTTTTNELGIKYYTGLSIKNGAYNFGTLNEVADGDVEGNYISYSGEQPAGKKIDYLIYARGANNDGNHVMMRITYSVDLGGASNKIEVSHNLLFKVEPNSTVRFKSKHEASSIYNAAGIETVDGKTIASNYENPYAIDGTDPVKFYLYNNTQTALLQENSTVQAYLYGNTDTTLNNSNRFTYKYLSSGSSTYQGNKTYNDYTLNITDATGWTDISGGKENAYSADRGAVAVNTVALQLGSRYYVIEGEDEYGYKLRFYFTITAPSNPQIYSADTSITEGESIAVWLRTKTVSIAGQTADDQRTVVYNPFTFIKNDSTGNFSNTILVKNPTKIANVRVTVLGVVVDDGSDAHTTIDGVSEIYRDFTLTDTSEDGSFNIYAKQEDIGSDVNKWKYVQVDSNGTPKAPQNVSVKASIVGDSSPAAFLDKQIRITLTIKENADIGSYTLTYSEGVVKDGVYQPLNLIQTHTPSSGYAQTNFPADINYIELDGFKAYGYSKDIGAFDKNSVLQTVSDFEKMTISDIEFLYNNVSLGHAGYHDARSGSVITSPDNNPNIYTNDQYVFINNSRTGVFRGMSYDLSAEDAKNVTWIAPHISGVYYGVGSVLSGVTMRITLRDTESGNTCKMDQIVTLTREAATAGIFMDTAIVDGNTIATSDSSLNFRSNNIFNDTLEVVLEAGASATLAFSHLSASEASAAGVSQFADSDYITVTNSKPYTITEYVGISSNISAIRNFTSPNFMDYLGESGTPSPNKFYLKVLDTTTPGTVFRYNKSDTINKNGTAPITYGAVGGQISLNIEDVEELNGSGYKEETLFFLLKDTESKKADGTTSWNRVYQHKEVFKVYPEWQKLTSTKTTTTGAIDFVVDNYYKVSSAQDAYYVITRNQWATEGDLKVVKYSSAVAAGLFADTPAHHFLYEINTGESGAGSAFIDENGTITTSPSFEISEETITVNVYMKVSGYDGLFSEKYEDRVDDKKLKLATFRLSLKVKSDSAENTSTAGVYQNGLLHYVIPTGYTLNGLNLNPALFSASGVASIDSIGTFATTIGTQISFRQLFGNTNRDNIDYYLVHIKDNSNATAGYTGEYVARNNLNYYTFTAAGNYTLTFLQQDDKSGASPQNVVKQAKLIVYGSATKEVIQTALQVGKDETGATVTADAPNGIEAGCTVYNLASTSNWYELESNGRITERTKFVVEKNKTGVFTKTFIAEDKTTRVSRIVNVTLYVYSAVTTKEVVVSQDSKYDISPLADTGAKFYEYVGTTYTQATTYTANGAIGTVLNKTYIVNVGTTWNRLDVEFYVTNNNAPNTHYVDVLKSGTAPNQKGAFADKVVEVLELTGSYEIWEIGSSNILTTAPAQSDVGASEYTVTKTYLVSANSTLTRHKFTFYMYLDKQEIATTKGQNTALPLTEFNADILTELGLASGMISYFEIDSVTGTLKNVTTETVNAEESFETREYYIRVETATEIKWYIYSFAVVVDLGI